MTLFDAVDPASFSRLTPSELQSLHGVIDKQDWLTAEERKFLYGQLDPTVPPAPEYERREYGRGSRAAGAVGARRRHLGLD